ncbi:hypothetical protein D6853_05660 [Butyrivibrio sp. X503]|uniref:hypothetical protein n=1 Tax=Butyrivibrio sp. X503 TaxID=2364878 RepID=UPI000EAA91DD|nr:hypothetical protein [Butyrivibrio sp. X503]RKM56281.1 hypothetical protein D6853_05660 [Butyrivibrio sp. X503]
MYGLGEMLRKEKERLQAIKQIVDKRLEGAPEGYLRISTSRKHVHYMHCTENKTGSYIKKDDMGIIWGLAQKTYDARVKKLVDRRVRQLDKIAEEYRDNEIEEIYERLHPIRKKIVKAAVVPWEQRLKEWKSKAYIGKEFDEKTPIIYSKKGERVRSKSEKILADYFYDNGIEYKYECPINLRGYGVVYPDFTFLRKRDGKEIYWEHDGRMDDPKYAEKAIRKINSYMLNKIFPGDNLILTFESSNVVLNDKIIKVLATKHGL